jgi:hypothetical protein
MINVVLVDFGCGIPHKDVVDCAQALTIQATQHFGLNPPFGYGFGAMVRAAAGPFDVKPHEWVIGLFREPSQAGALGYHDQTQHGQPLAKVFPLLDPATKWTTIASHELLELLADPNVARCSLAEDGQVWAYEVCDACESYAYSIHVASGATVMVSDFVLPPYFEPMPSMLGLKRDWMGLIKHPLEILSGGYGQTYTPDAGWSQHQHAAQAPSAYRQAVSQLGRGAKRRA